MTRQLDPFHIQIVCNYLKFKEDFLNIIQVKKQFEFLLDRFRINPIPITKETEKLFKFLDTQQIFYKETLTENENKKTGEKEIVLSTVDIQQYNCKVSYSQYKEITADNNKRKEPKRIKFKRITYTKEDREIYGDEIPDEIQVLGKMF